MRPFLSLSILAYNEKDTLERVARVASTVLEACGKTYELVLVDDGSTDGSEVIIDRLTEELPHCRPIHHPRNLGIGAGIRTCYFATLGQWATWFPADLQADLHELPRLLAYLSNCEVLVTYRDPKRRKETRRRKLLSLTERALTGLFFGVSLRDLHWIRFFRRDVLNRLHPTSHSPFIDTEMIIGAKKLGAHLCEVLLDDQPRESGVAKGASLPHVITSVVDLISLYLRGVRVSSEGGVAARITPFT